MKTRNNAVVEKYIYIKKVEGETKDTGASRVAAHE